MGPFWGPNKKGPKKGPKMAKIAKKLTDTEIKNTKPAEKEINLFDGDGLMLRIAPLFCRWQEKLVFQVCGTSN